MARRRQRKSRTRRLPRRSRWAVVRVVLGALLLPVLIAIGLGVIALDTMVKAKFSGAKWALPAHVYGRPLELYAGRPLARAALLRELDGLGYRKAPQAEHPGQFKISGNTLDIHVRAFRFPDGEQPAQRARVGLDATGITAIGDSSGAALPLLRLEPVRIGGIYPEHAEDRVLLRLAELPPYLADALIATEDRDFYSHHGVSPRAILRAVWANLRAGGIAQGGSTLTQQLVKNLYLSQNRTLVRKAMEAVMAMLLELHYSKQEILEAYLNEIHLGQAGDRAIHGFGLASEFYFRQPLAELDLHQVALLVALAKGASYYNPRRQPERALARRNLVLAQLAEEGVIDAARARVAARQPLDVTAAPGGINQYPDYMDLVRRRLQEDYNASDLTANGLRIFTYFDPQAQRQVEAAIADTLRRIEAERKLTPGQIQAAAVVVGVGTGEVLALAGSRSGQVVGFNRALDARRTIGSTAKPAVYLAALEQPGRYTLGTLVDDAPLSIVSGGKPWSPENFDHKSHGPVPIYVALSRSYNQATARLGLEVGVDRVADVVRRLGYAGPLLKVPALLLGGISMTPFELAGMYHTIAADGFHTDLRAIASVSGADREILSRYPFAVEQRFAAESMHLLHYALRQVMTEGTGANAYRQLPAGLKVAGKTGTSNDQRDSWFAGFSGNHLVVVWLGRDDNGPMPLSGASGALRVWSAIMAGLDNRPLPETHPEEITYAWYDPGTGGGSGEGCANARLLPYISGSEPEGRGCLGGVPGQVLDRVRGWLGID
ncbi:MAG: penicillin-binding protein 1B [Gammaproteobacteria bacterium]|nr:penicillin-binding protein 1B [Gammaproteobacteria bacterium]